MFSRGEALEGMYSTTVFARMSFRQQFAVAC
uniref:Uncharacterized protein n=1 Tax=Anguilla anguilla TaxID=7936 RepID=A0A0E9THR6_ANGAN